MKVGKINKLRTQRDIIKIIGLVINNKLHPASLSKEEQTLIIEFLRYEENFTIAKIAALLGLHRDTVRSRLKKIDEAMRARLIARGFDPWTVISELFRVKAVVQSKAAQMADWGLIWKTEMDTMDKLLKIGLIKEHEPDEILNGEEAEEYAHAKFDKKTLMNKLKEMREA
ncbi:MAG: helix-turn-helix domain-containing protein [Deltaproteobacteria bacterium]